ncbi:MAG: alpha/beta fold hydrolase [Myxococcota bacterium]
MPECPTVFLHGFGGAPAAWQPVIDAWPSNRPPLITPRLPGHGAAIDGIARFDDAIDALIARLPDRMNLVGYSLGGRLALGIAHRFRSKVARLALIGANPGIDAAARPSRRQTDEDWARQLQAEGVEAFFDRWIQQPLFATQRALPAEVLARQRAWRAHLDPRDLATTMRALSLSAMPDYRPTLGDLDMPVLLMVGAQDHKFRAISESMMAHLPNAQLDVVDNVGHNVPLEAPALVALRLARFLSVGSAQNDG